MGHRRRIQKKNFKCGHRGLGQYCHLCRQIESGKITIDDIQSKEIQVIPNIEEPVQIANIEGPTPIQIPNSS